ncbi:DUF6517 family protein [Halostella litorea]|uniref:DUF6517 family protein n=1 Tax=Halostella litorea TaxID=2528831 RepID=UPI001092BE24|nr:DUF6517 family protein [Halostella litorea]
MNGIARDLSTRRLIATVAVALLLATSGCIGFILGNAPAEFTAANATAGEDALAETGYGLNESRTVVENRTLDELGNRTVRVEGHANLYTKSDEFLDRQQQVGMFAAVSVPQVEVAGRSFNPISDQSNAELVDRFQSEISAEYRDVDLTATGSKSVDGVLGKRANVTRFTGTSEFQGREVEVAIYVTKVKHDGDWVVLMGAHPTQRPEEEFNVEALMQSVEHESE